MTIYQLSERLGQALLLNQLTVTTAESCTGGGIAAAITDTRGSSAWFERGFVTYSNEAKMEMLSVSAETLSQFGAVSEAVAIEMAQGARSAARADLAVSVSGIAGPDGGSKEKPVGTVCFAIACASGPISWTCHFAGDRRQVREAAVQCALDKLLQALETESASAPRKEQ